MKNATREYPASLGLKIIRVATSMGSEWELIAFVEALPGIISSECKLAANQLNMSLACTQHQCWLSNG